MEKTLLVGIARSGTTWLGNSLSKARGTFYIGEPDSSVNDPFGAKAKRNLGRFPVLVAGDQVPADFDRLWERAFNGRRTSALPVRAARSIVNRAARRFLKAVPRSELNRVMDDAHIPVPLPVRLAFLLGIPKARPYWAENVVVKSVHAVFALEWIADRWSPQIVIILRHPLNVLSSWLALGIGASGHHLDPTIRARYIEPFGLPLPPPDASPLQLAAWEVGLRSWVLASTAERNPEWTVIFHEDLCLAPLQEFERLYASLGLEWTSEAQKFIRASDRDGSGFVTNRVAGSLPGAWRNRLTSDQLEEIRGVLLGFPFEKVVHLNRWAEDGYLVG